MSLTFNRETGDFILSATAAAHDEAARLAGLTLSRSATHNGRRVYFTRDEYAALAFWPLADEATQAVLADRRAEYDMSWRRDGDRLTFPAPPGVAYRPFQLAGIDYCLRRPHALIGDQPGLGKTVQAIGVANALEAQRVLVICPGKVRLQWAREICRWSTIRRVQIYPVIRSLDGVSPRAHYIVTSYDLARTEIIHRLLMALDWDLLVLDEAHALKTPEAIRTRSIFGGGASFAREWLAMRARKVVALTGTPLPNRPRECYTLARGLCWEAIDFMSKEAFERRYNPSFQYPSGRIEERQGRLPELQARLRCNLMVRRLKKDVLEQLPQVTWELAYVDIDGQIRKALRAEGLLGIDPNDLEGADMELLGQVSTVRREMGEAKAPRVADHVEMLVEGGVEKVVLFFHHRSVGDILQERLKRFGLARVDGRTSSVAQHQAVQRFVADSSVKIFMGHIEVAGTGVDRLQEVCSHAVFAEASWVPKDNEQAVDRLHRMGQQSAVVAQFLVAPGSLDERVLGTAIEKRHAIHAALDHQ